MIATISGVGTALPPRSKSQAAVWEDFFKDHYGGSVLADRIWQGSGVETRCGVLDPAEVDISSWGTSARMQLFVREAVPLGKAALLAALSDGGMEAADVDFLAVVSCTGYVTPGLDILLARELELSPSIERLHVGHMGCHAAIPALATVASTANAREKSALMLCVELPTLHLQPATKDLGQMVTHALFADAAGALAIVPAQSQPGLDVIDVIARTDPKSAKKMTWEVTELGFKMGLSPSVARVLRKHVKPVVDELLERNGLAVTDVDGWVIHPGGLSILEAVAQKLELSDQQLAHSYAILRDVGNCSSATVLLVLEELLRNDSLEPGAHVVMLAFGPGLTLYGALLQSNC